jgi:hypothetical protein
MLLDVEYFRAAGLTANLDGMRAPAANQNPALLKGESWITRHVRLSRVFALTAVRISSNFLVHGGEVCGS